jgi:hypothetical protein
MRHFAPLVILGLACCDSRAAQPSTLPVSGTWSFSQFAQRGDASCGEGGVLDFVQTGAMLRGTFNTRGACDTSTTALDFVRSGDVESAGIDGVRLRFALGVCRYEGTLAGDPPTQAGGTLTCTGLPGTSGELPGTWEMRR